MKSKKRNSGQGLVEYMILVALMAVATIGVVRVLSQNLTAQFANISHKLQGGPNANKKEKMDSISHDHTKLKDMGSFMDDTQTNE